MADARIFSFYVNPFTDELVVDRFDPPHDDAAIDRYREALRGQGVIQSGMWYVGDAHNWGTSTMAKWTYSKIPRGSRSWHAEITIKREFIEKHRKKEAL